MVTPDRNAHNGVRMGSAKRTKSSLKKKEYRERKTSSISTSWFPKLKKTTNKQKKMEKTKKRLTHTHTQKGFDDGDEGDDDGGGGGG